MPITKHWLGLALLCRLNIITGRNFTTFESDTFPKQNVVFSKAISSTKNNEKKEKKSYSANVSYDRAKKFDLAVVGGGIVGTASAREILIRHPKLKMVLLEKENRLAVHQTGHNSGVLHCGIYYTPGSLKAKLCVEGIRLLYEYCDQKKIPYKKCGKLIVATTLEELKRLNVLYDRGLQNNVPDMQILCQSEIKNIEPYCDGLGAIYSPLTGIIDYAKVTNFMGKDFTSAGGEIKLNYEVDKFEDSKDPQYPIKITSASKEVVLAKNVLTCAGLQSDRVAMKTGCSKNPQIVPFRGEYLVLNAEKRYLVKGNIYPVPDPNLPFLGVHCTLRMDGNVWLGPNALLSFKREGYRWNDINVKDLFEIITHTGIIKLAMKNFVYGVKEIVRSVFIPLQVANLNRFLADLTEVDVQRGPSGVRAQAIDAKGNLVDDFVFDRGVKKPFDKVLHCRNAPSPGATSSMAIAKMIADEMEKQLKEDETMFEKKVSDC